MSERRNGIENTSKSRGRRASQTALTIVTGAPVSAKVDGGPGIRIMPPLPFIAYQQLSIGMKSSRGGQQAAPNDMGWASDVAAEMLRKLNIKYVSLKSRCELRGFHDSLVNYLATRRRRCSCVCTRIMSSRSRMCYAKVADEPMACVLHSNVGLMHGLMGVFQRLVRPDANSSARRDGASCRR
jgi:hypothetical protein